MYISNADFYLLQNLGLWRCLATSWIMRETSLVDNGSTDASYFLRNIEVAKMKLNVVVKKSGMVMVQ